MVYTRSPEHNAKIGAALLGHRKPDLEPTVRPTINDICWAAGLYEGDGSCARDGQSSARADVQQAEAGQWVVDKLRNLFGGSTLPVERKEGSHFSDSRKDFRWSVSGARARGFLQTIYGLLSPRRQEQVRNALRIGEFS